MTNYTIFTSNAGHSSKSPGASGNGFKEHEQTRYCNKQFIGAMKARGCTVTDTTSDARNKSAVLLEQVAIANKVNKGDKQLNVSWHFNAGGGTGVEVLYYGADTKALSQQISSALAKELGIRNRGAKQRKDLYFLRKTKAAALIIEVCFIDNEEDMQQYVKFRTKAISSVADILAGPAKASTNSSTVSTASGYTGSSLVDYLKTIQKDSSFKNRAKLAVQYKIVSSQSQYAGTPAQNTALLAAMRKGGAK